MKVAAAVVVTLLLGAGVSDAAWWPKKKLPKPTDYPIVRPKAKDTHKPMNRARHPPESVFLIEVQETARA